MLRQLECLVQPAVLLLEHGTETLATSIHSLLQVHPNPYPNPNLNPKPKPNPDPSPNPNPNPKQGRPSDLLPLRPKGTGRRAAPLREHCAVLTAAFRVLRASAASTQVAPRPSPAPSPSPSPSP